MSSQWQEDESEEEVEEEEDKKNHKDREHVVFLVDVSPNMIDEVITIQNDDGTGREQMSGLSIAMRTIADMMKKRIVSGAKDEYAVILYNTVAANNPGDHPHVFVLVERDQPTAGTIQTLTRLSGVEHVEVWMIAIAVFNDVSRGIEIPEEYNQEIQSWQPPADAVAELCEVLKSALREVKDQLTNGNSRSASYRIIAFSNTEDPLAGMNEAGRAEYMDTILFRIDPLKDIGASMRFFPLISSVRPFAMHRFWDRLLEKLRDPDDEYEPNPVSQFSQTPAAVPPMEVRERLDCLGEYMKKCLQKRRATTTLRWQITDQLDISIQVFDLMVEQKRPFSMRLRASDNAPLQSNVAKVNADTGEIITRVEHKSYQPKDKAAHRLPRVLFTTDEVAAIKYYLPPGLKLLGFKPRRFLQDYHNLQHSSFLRPTEREVKGSTTVFRALLGSMIRKDCIAVCRYVRTRRSEPVLVALVAQEEELDAAKYQVWAEGMHMIRLPFKDDIRNPETDPIAIGTELISAESHEVEAAAQVIDKLQYLDFTLGQASNPVLDRHFQVLEALALGEEGQLDDARDDTLPPDDIDKDAGRAAVFEAFRKTVSLGVKESGAGSKRKAPAQDLSIAEQYALQDWAQHAQAGTLKKLTLPDLKIYLTYNKLKTSGKKDDLVARILEHMGLA